MRNNKGWLIFGAIVFLGILFSMWDYKVWKKAETEKYGQGWEGQGKVTEIAPLVGPYVNKVWKVRVRYPKDWTLKENFDYSETNLYRKPLPVANKKVQIVEFVNTAQPMSIGVWGEIVPNKNLVDIVTEQAIGITGDREYNNSDKAKFIIIHWESPSEVKYWAFSRSSDIVFLLEGKSAPPEASLMQKTLVSMLEAFIPL